MNNYTCSVHTTYTTQQAVVLTYARVSHRSGKRVKQVSINASDKAFGVFQQWFQPRKTMEVLLYLDATLDCESASVGSSNCCEALSAI